MIRHDDHFLGVNSFLFSNAVRGYWEELGVLAGCSKAAVFTENCENTGGKSFHLLLDFLSVFRCSYALFAYVLLKNHIFLDFAFPSSKVVP